MRIKLNYIVVEQNKVINKYNLNIQLSREIERKSSFDLINYINYINRN